MDYIHNLPQILTKTAQQQQAQPRLQHPSKGLDSSKLEHHLVQHYHPPEPTLCFASSELEDVVPHENDLVVISVVTVERKVHTILIDQGSSVDVMFWITFTSLQLSPEQLRPYDGCLVGFTGD